MRPLSLEVEGLTAFRKPQHINLADLGLFVITGRTGAGKTSILDAVTLALYGDVCRATKSGELKHFITHNAPLAKVQLEFSAQGHRYRVVRKLKRIGQPEALLERMEGDEFIPLTGGVRAVNAQIVELLGLDFDGFTKAVLLPQGRFHEFLSGDANIRRDILSGLLDLDKFNRMGTLARSEARDIAVSLDERSRRLNEDYADATPEHLAIMQGNRDEASQLVTALRSAAKRSTELIGSYRRASETIGLIDKDLEPLRQLERESGELNAQAALINERDEGTAAAAKAARERLVGAQAVREKAEAALRGAIREFGDEGKLTELHTSAEALEEETQNLNSVEARTVEAESEKLEAAKRRQEMVVVQESAAASLEEARREGERQRDAHIEALRLVELVTATENLTRATAALSEANEALSQAAAERSQRLAEVEHFTTEHVAAGLRSTLAAGDPCPVCERPVDVVPAGLDGLTALIASSRQRLTDSERVRKETNTSAGAAHAKHSVAQSKVDELLPLVSERPLPDLATARDRAAAVETALKQARESYAPLFEAHRAAMTSAQAAEGALGKATAGCEEQKRRRDDLVSRIDRARQRLVGAFGSDLPTDLVLTIKESLETVRGMRLAAREAENTREIARRAEQVAQSERDAFENDLQTALRRFHGLRGMAWTAATTLRTSAPAVSLEPLECIDPEQPLAVQVAALNAFCASTVSTGERDKGWVAGTREDAERQLREIGRTAQIEAGDATAEQIDASVQAAVREAEMALMDVDRALVQLHTRIAKRNEIEAGMVSGRQQQKLCQRLGMELRADGFLAYVLSESMRTLAARATVELKRITDDRYSIEPKESNFEVIDHMNADERRPVATLSGGETFLASLALALALAGSVRDLAGNAAAARLESMFIDEGFGALDADTLDVAVNALEQLAEDHRMIGVISHVPTLAERIPGGIDVKKVGSSSVMSRR